MNALNESILGSVKLSLGIPEEYEHFDSQILFHLNSVQRVQKRTKISGKI